MSDPEILWPLRAVSKDPTNLTKLDADNNVLTSTTDVAATFVQKAGDTMTGPLIVKPTTGPTTPNGGIQITGDNTNASFVARYAGATNGNAQLRFTRSRGTIDSPLQVQPNDQMGAIVFQALRADAAYTTPVSFATLIAADADVSGTNIKGRLNVNVNDGAGIKTPLTIDGTLVTFQFPVALNGGITGNLSVPDDFLLVVRGGSGDSVAIRVADDAVQLNKPAYLSGGVASDVVVLPGGRVLVQNGTVQSRRAGIDPDIGFASASFESSGVGKTVVGLGCGVQGTGGVDFTAALQIGNAVDAPTSYAIYSGSVAQSVIQGKLGLNRFVPTHQLDVGGDAIVRGPLEVTGNITSAGTAHSFAAGSIPSTAVIGNTPRTIAATGSAGNAGQMVWDDNFLYLHTTAGWKKVALTAI